MADLKISGLPASTTPLAGSEVLPIVQSSTTKKVAVSDLTAGRSVSVSTLASTGSGDSYFTGNLGVGISTPSSVAHFVAPSNATDDYTLRLGFTFNSTSVSMGAIGTTNISGDSGGLKFSVSYLGTLYQALELTPGKDVNATAGNFVPATAAKGVNFTANTPAAGMTSQLLNWYEEGTWTPSIGGNATYNNRSGYYTRVGRQVTAFFLVQVNVKGTGSADTVSGLPFTVSSSTTIRGGGSIQYFESLAVSTAWLSPVANSNTTTFSFIGQNAVDDTCLDAIALFQDGTFVIGSIVYFV